VRWGPFVHADLADTDRLLAAMREHRITAVMHFAAYGYVGESVTNPARYFRNNVVNAVNLLDAMLAAEIPHIVFSSSCATYGTPDVVPITEAAPQRPINPYGDTKLIMEHMLKWYGDAYKLRACMLRYFNAAGADPDGEIGEDHDPETHLIPLILDAAIGRRPQIDIFGTDYPTRDGTAVRDYIHVQDLAAAHVRAIAYLQEGGGSIAMNLGTGDGHTVREVVDAAERITGRKVPRRLVARRAGDPPELVADPRLAWQVLGWQAEVSDLDTIISTAWAWHVRKNSPTG
jgi:UDP-glucose-4-epimerase GalE